MEESEDLTETLTVEQVQENLHIGRNKAYEVFAREDFPAITIGRRFCVDKVAFEVWKKSRRANENKEE